MSSSSTRRVCFASILAFGLSLGSLIEYLSHPTDLDRWRDNVRDKAVDILNSAWRTLNSRADRVPDPVNRFQRSSRADRSPIRPRPRRPRRST